MKRTVLRKWFSAVKIAKKDLRVNCLLIVFGLSAAGISFSREVKGGADSELNASVSRAKRKNKFL
jgi:hypothetical protein